MTDATVIALIMSIPPTVAATAALIATMRTHSAVDGRMDELLKLVKTSAFAAGVKSETDKGPQ